MGEFMEVKELIKASRGLRIWSVLIFTAVTFLSFQNANPPTVNLAPQNLVAAR
jgi:hypothetical protein